MAQQVELKSMDDLVRHVGRYPDRAFVFVREGLSYVTEQIHGQESEAHRALQEHVAANGLDWSDLVSQYYSGTLPDALSLVIDEAGGWEKMNRHVSGRELCWGLRDFALHRWGLLARTVIESWNIRSTSDFGRIVFGFIDFDLMQKQPGDSIEDFDEIYSFDVAFDEAYRAGLSSADADAVEQDQE